MDNKERAKGVNKTSMSRRIAKFEKVSLNQFKRDCTLNQLYLGDVVYEDLKLPERATKGSAGYDFVSPCEFRLRAGNTIIIPTGIRCEMNPDYALFIMPRSGLGFKYQIFLSNTIGLIDSDYYNSDNEGHIMIKLFNQGKTELHIKKGEKFCQGVFLPYGITIDDECGGERNGGFGSTGK